MKIVAVITVFLFAACAAPAIVHPPVVTGPTCAEACAHLLELGCKTGQPTPEGTMCEQVCQNVEDTGLPQIRWPRACVARADTCEAAERCE